MDWGDFFEKTRVAAKVESFSKLAPLLGITDGAIGHYRQGRRVPQVWVVAEALKIQGHPHPEKAAITIMKAAALTSPERTFWKRLSASAVGIALLAATLLAVGVPGSAYASAQDGFRVIGAVCLLCYGVRTALTQLRHNLQRRKRNYAYLLALQG